MTFLSEKWIIFHGFPQNCFVECHGISTFKLQYKFIKQQQFGYFLIWCDYMAFQSSFQPELSSDPLHSYIDCYIANCSPLYFTDFRGQSTKYGGLYRRLVTYMPAYKHGFSTVHFIPLIFVCIYTSPSFFFWLHCSLLILPLYFSRLFSFPLESTTF